MIDLQFIFLTYAFGPILSVPYAIKYLYLNTLDIFIYMTVLHILLLPAAFHTLEFLGHKKLYKSALLGKYCKVCEIKAEEEMEKITDTGDKLIDVFETRMGHLGFYLAISTFTFLFGVVWAALLAYLLKVNRRRAIWSISLGIIVGNVFWVLVIAASLPRVHMEFFVIALVGMFLLYGRKREIAILKKVYHVVT